MLFVNISYCYLILQPQTQSAVDEELRAVAQKRRRAPFYTHYTPEAKIKIGQWAAKHGNIKASVKFNMPESTARGFKKKYLALAESGDLNLRYAELNHSRRDLYQLFFVTCTLLCEGKLTFHYFTFFK